ncbi:MAG: hypothetical protein HQL27_02405 [Candidatus Omnitrophica bacterium]|nr:hypothetical protein [Candidatus Omnitrophota bacterium]
MKTIMKAQLKPTRTKEGIVYLEDDSIQIFAGFTQSSGNKIRVENCGGGSAPSDSTRVVICLDKP